MDKQLKYKWDGVIFNQEYWDNNLSKEIEDNLNSYLEQIINPLKSEFLTKQNNLVEANQSFKKNHNEFLYALTAIAIPFGLILLIFPGIWLIKKFRMMKKNKNNLKAKINECEQEQLETNLKIINTIDLVNLYNTFLYKYLNFYNCGPISSTLINTIKSLSSFYLESSDYFNTLNTHWGVFNNNIVINYNNQKHWMGKKTYHGSTTIYVPVKTNNGSGTVAKTVSASYTHPYPEFYRNNEMWCFSEYCDNLEFNYESFHRNKLFDKKKKSSSPLENQKFEKSFSWTWNDDTQIRMVFTPWFQETYLKMTNNQEPKKWLQLRKIKSFFGTNFQLKEINNNNLNYCKPLLQFKTDPAYSFDLFKSDIRKIFIDRLFEYFCALSFMTIIPVIQTEDQINIINQVLQQQKSKKEAIDISLESHYVLNEVLDMPLFRLDTDTFHIFDNQNFNFKQKYIIVPVTAYSFKKIPKVYYESVSTEVGLVTVPIRYDDFIKHNKNGWLIYGRTLPNISLYDSIQNITNVDKNKIKKIVSLANSIAQDCYQNKFVIRNGFFALLIDNEDSLNNVQKQLDAITQLIC